MASLPLEAVPHPYATQVVLNDGRVVYKQNFVLLGPKITPVCLMAQNVAPEHHLLWFNIFHETPTPLGTTREISIHLAIPVRPHTIRHA